MEVADAGAFDAATGNSDGARVTSSGLRMVCSSCVRCVCAGTVDAAGFDGDGSAADSSLARLSTRRSTSMALASRSVGVAVAKDDEATATNDELTFFFAAAK